MLLRMLAEADGYEANAFVLQRALEAYGHAVSRDAVHTELAWLAEQGLVTTTSSGSFVVARLTARGLDTSSGAAHVPGVKRPVPEI